MLYDAYFTYDRVGSQFRKAASGFERYFRIWGADAPWPTWRRFGAFFELGEMAGFTHSRPDFGITHIRGANGGMIDIKEDVVASTPFCDLVRFSREGSQGDIRVLLVAPMSGHFATLLRATIRTLLQDFEVYVTDWRNARDVPLSEGVMTLDRFTATSSTSRDSSGRARISSRSASRSSPRWRRPPSWRRRRTNCNRRASRSWPARSTRAFRRPR